MAQILTRAMQLKLAHWGKRATGTEVEAKLSKQCAVLSMIFDFPTADWPRLPLPGSDVPLPGARVAAPGSLLVGKDIFTGEEIAASLKLLAEGMNIDAPLEVPLGDEGEDEEEEGEDADLTRGKMALWGWHVDLKDTVRKLLEVHMTTVNRHSRRHIFKSRREEAEVWICAVREVQLGRLGAKLKVSAVFL